MTRRITARIIGGFAALSMMFSTMSPALAQSSGAALSIAPFLNKVNKYILNPIIALMFGVALIYFFWGIFQFVLHADGDKEREEGKQNILWGVIGIFIMVSVYGIIRLILGTLGPSVSSPGYLTGI